MAATFVATAIAQAPNPTPYERAAALVARMTFQEQLGLLQGFKPTNTTEAYCGVVKGVPRLAVPDLKFSDGPEGYRTLDPYKRTSTQWPSGQTVARTFSVDSMRKYGEAMGQEFRQKGANVQFGPAVNVARVPNAGRSFEYLSGEDPFLGYVLVQPLVEGIQGQGVIANVKHWILNDQEGFVTAGMSQPGAGDRHFTSSEIDEQTMMELYFPPFEGAIEAGVLSVMCANSEFRTCEARCVRAWPAGWSAVRA